MLTVPVPPQEILRNPQAIRAWFESLTDLDKTAYSLYLLKLADKAGISSTLPTLGEVAATPAFSWGGFATGLTSSLINVGADLYNTGIIADTQKDLASIKSNADMQSSIFGSVLSSQTQAQQTQAQIDIAKLQGGVQTQLATIGGASQVDIARIQAETAAKIAAIKTPMYITLGIGGLAVVALGGLLWWKKGGKKRGRR